MLPIDVDRIVAGSSSVEWERIEFKSGWNPLDVIQTLCAFANDLNNLDGGYIFIGIAEKNGRPVMPPLGLDENQVDRIQKELLNFGNSKISPPYHPIAIPHVIDGKTILVLWASGGQNRPYKCVNSLAKDDKTRKYFVRRLSSTVEAKGHDLNELLTLAQNVPFDDRYNQLAKLSDLELPLIRRFLDEVGSELSSVSGDMDFEELCRRMKIAGSSSEFPLPHNVGLMFFNSRPDNFFPHSQIDVVVFPDGTAGDSIIEKRFFGPIDVQIRDALNYIEQTVIEEVTLKHADSAQAERFFNYPFQALEELIVNAVYHRSYELREPIEVRVLPTKIVIVSYPGPDRSIDLQSLASGNLVARRYRNRRIGEFLKELRLTEGRGTGIPKAIRVMIQNGSPQPTFKTDVDRSYFEVALEIHPRTPLKAGVEKGVATPTLTPTTPPTLMAVLNDRAIEILEYCRSPRSRKEVQNYTGMRDKKHLRERYIYPLLNAKLLALSDPDNPLSRNQKLRTTKLGAAAASQYRAYQIHNAAPTLFDDLD